jgi:hypothetical protein
MPSPLPFTLAKIGEKRCTVMPFGIPPDAVSEYLLPDTLAEVCRENVELSPSQI